VIFDYLENTLHLFYYVWFPKSQVVERRTATVLTIEIHGKGQFPP